MFVYNIKLNNKNLAKTVLIAIIVIIIAFFLFSTYKIVKESFKVEDNIAPPDVQNISVKNYTNILKSVHEDINTYLGKKIHFSGYVYRLSDFKESEFVLARDMIVSSNMKTLIVGFLCNSNKAKDFADESWVEITGEITKGNYHGDIPVIKITEIKQIEKPKDDIYAYPPDDSYVPTSAMF